MSKAPWPGEKPNWLDNGLPVYQGGKDRALARSMVDNLGGPQGFRKAERNSSDGTVTRVTLRGDMAPEVVVTGSEVISSGLRGFVAHSSTGSASIVYNPYLDVPIKAYTPKTFQYSVTQYISAYNSGSSNGLIWNDVLTNASQVIRLNSKAYPPLVWARLDPTEIPVIPSETLPSDNSRIFGVSANKVRMLSSGDATTTETLTPTDPIDNDRALLCGAQISTGSVLISQVYYTGPYYDNPSSSWFYSAKQIAISLTVPYITSVFSTGTLEVPTASPALTNTTAVNEHSPISISGQIAESGTTYIDTIIYDNPPPDTVNFVAIRINEPDMWVSGPVAGTEVTTGNETTYSAVVDEVMSCSGEEFAASLSNTVRFRDTNSYRYMNNDQVLESLPEPQLSGTNAVYSDHVYDAVGWGGDPGEWPRPISVPDRTIDGEYYGPTTGNTYNSKTQSIDFSISSTLFSSLIGTISVSNNQGYRLTTIARSSSSFRPKPLLACEIYNNHPITALRAAAGAIVLSKANEYVGVRYYNLNPPVWDTSRNDLETIITKSIDITTRDYILYDLTNETYVYVEGVFTGRGGDVGGSMTIDVTLVIESIYGVTPLLLSTVTVGYDLLPEEELDTGKECVPSPTLRTFFAPQFRDQSDFRGAVYTTKSEREADIPDVCEMSFTLTLASFDFIGTDRQTTSNIVFVPLNLLEMLYAFVYSSKYGAGILGNKYPITRTVTYDLVNPVIFGTTTNVVWKNGAYVAWPESLDTPYDTDSLRELYRT